MARLEELTRGASVSGVLPNKRVTVVNLAWHGTVAELTYRDEAGHLGSALLYRHNEPDLAVMAPRRAWSFEQLRVGFPEFEEAFAVVTDDAVPLRGAPALTGVERGFVHAGDGVQITGSGENGWLPVKTYEGQSGWLPDEALCILWP
jgi:hypothetical protein